MIPCSIEAILQVTSKQNAEVNPKPEQQQEYDRTLFDLQSLIAHELSHAKYKSILDVGCAYGTLTAFLADNNDAAVSAYDAMPELSSQEWWDKHNVTFAAGNLETDELPFKGQSLIIFTEVLEHLCYGPVPVIEKLYAALAPGGEIICTTPMKELQGIFHPNDGRYSQYAHYRDIPLPWNGYQFEDKHHYFYQKHELMQLFHEVGFEVEECFSIRRGTTHWLKARRPA